MPFILIRIKKNFRVEKKRIFKVKKDGIKKSTTYNLVKNDGELATLKFDKQEICFHTENDR